MIVQNTTEVKYGIKDSQSTDETINSPSHQLENQDNKHHRTIHLSTLLGSEYYQNQVRKVFCAAELTLLSVDVVTQTFDSEVKLHVFWQQTGFSKKTAKFLSADALWSVHDDGASIPLDLDDLFEGDLDTQWIQKEFYFHPPNSDQNESQTVGVIEMLLHVKSKFAERMELKRFPADRQFLNILLKGRTTDGNFEWVTSNNSKIDWVPVKFRAGNQIKSRLGPAMSTDHAMFAPWADFRIINSEFDQQPPFKLRFRVQRYAGFYIGNIFVPMISIVLCCYASLAIPIDQVANRLTVSVTLLLVIVAFKFVIASLLPPISYLTWMDFYVIIHVLVITLFIIENTIAHTIDSNTENNSAINIDWIFGIIVGIIVFIVNFLMIFASSTHYFRHSWEEMDKQDRDNDADDYISGETQNILSELTPEKYQNSQTA